MNPNHRQDTYTMPLKQLMKLLETTADDASQKTRRPRRRHEPKSPAVHDPDAEYLRF